MKLRSSLSLAAAVVIAFLTGCHQNVNLNDVPGPVRASLEKVAADGGEVGDIQKRQKNGKPIYLGEVKDKSGKWWDVQVAEDGTVLKKD